MMHINIDRENSYFYNFRYYIDCRFTNLAGFLLVLSAEFAKKIKLFLNNSQILGKFIHFVKGEIHAEK